MCVYNGILQSLEDYITDKKKGKCKCNLGKSMFKKKKWIIFGPEKKGGGGKTSSVL